MRIAAIQMEAEVADVAANLERAERLADAAAADGAEWISLPEFFTTGIGFVEGLAEAALPPDGEATRLLLELASRHDAKVGGSFLCRDADGHVRNAFLLATPDGVAGRHDKDLPTMWENSFYVGGEDDGIIEVDGTSVGVALCWETMRTQTVRRLRGRVDLVLGGSGWWSVPAWPPEALSRRLERGNAQLARRAAETFATYVGAPYAHGGHAGELRCAMPWLPLHYEGHFEGCTLVCDGEGKVLAFRDRRDGEGVAIADVEIGRRPVTAEAPDGFWLHRRGLISSFAWEYQKLHGRRWYRRHVAQPPAAESPPQRVPTAA